MFTIPNELRDCLMKQGLFQPNQAPKRISSSLTPVLFEKMLTINFMEIFHSLHPLRRPIRLCRLQSVDVLPRKTRRLFLRKRLMLMSFSVLIMLVPCRFYWRERASKKNHRLKSLNRSNTSHPHFLHGDFPHFRRGYLFQLAATTPAPSVSSRPFEA